MLAIPERHEFLAHEFDAFIELLRDIDQHTTRTLISHVDSVKLDGDSIHFRLLANGAAFSPLAIRQLCSHVSKGLWSLAADIAGVHRSANAYDSATSIHQAIGIINDCLELRFRAPDGLCGRDIIQNHKSGVVDGIVGPRYQLLPNHQLLEAVKEMMDSHEVPMQFYEGLLVGRRMAVTFLTEEPLVELDDGPLYGGAYFSNSEAGECGVRGATILQIGHTLRCMNKLRHLAHSGKDFIKRLGSTLAGVLHSWESTALVAKQAAEVMAKPLDLLNADDKLNKAKRTRMQTKLTKYIDKSLAEDVLRKAIFMGVEGTFVPNSVTAADIAKRQVRDVVIMLMRDADGQYPEIREKLERTAFDVLAKRVQL